MTTSQKVTIRDFEVEIVELTVGDVIDGIETFTGLLGPDSTPETVVNAEMIGKVMQLAERIVKMPEGKAIRDLKFSEIQELITPMIEVNAAFFGQMALLGLTPGGQLPAAVEGEPSLDQPEKT